MPGVLERWDKLPMLILPCWQQREPRWQVQGGYLPSRQLCVNGRFLPTSLCSRDRKNVISKKKKNKVKWEKQCMPSWILFRTTLAANHWPGVLWTSEEQFQVSFEKGANDRAFPERSYRAGRDTQVVLQTVTAIQSVWIMCWCSLNGHLLWLSERDSLLTGFFTEAMSFIWKTEQSLQKDLFCTLTWYCSQPEFHLH